jgi:xylose dehydrogenase (NAD/NADP)
MRLGLLSTARINGEILEGASDADRVEVVAVASRSAERAEAYAAEHGIPRSHGSYEALLEDSEIDAVYVSLPNGLHHEWTMLALQAGKHVLCEKPYSRNSLEVEEAFVAADAAGLVLMEAFMYRHHPQTEAIEAQVREGTLGRLLAVRSTFTFPLASLEDVRARPELAGGALMDVGCYCVNGSRLVAGEPASVLAEQVTGPTGIDMAFFGTMRFPGDVVGQFEASFLAPQRQSLEVVGEDAVLVALAPWRTDWPGNVSVVRGERTEVLEVPRGNAYAFELANMAAAVAGDASAVLGRDDALGQARTIEALYRSAASGAAISLA